MKDNPYIGPRPYERQDFQNFYGRAREARDLLSLILANRVVLFYAQSGAGKTSLLNAQIIPTLEERGFNVLPVARVGSDLPPGIEHKDVKNIFVFSVLMGLAGKDIPPRELTQETLLRFLRVTNVMGVAARTPERDDDEDATLLLTGSRRPPILIFDQFEEILTTHGHRWQDAQGFFEQLRDALRGLPELGVVLAMREDHVAGLDPYSALLPKRLKVRYRMEQLTVEGALEAVAKPALYAGVPFAPGVAERLVDDLRRIKTVSAPAPLARPDVDGGETVLGPYVEPVQLQVVCNRLWENLPEDLGRDIRWQEVEQYGNIDRALTEFYENAIAQACQAAKGLTGLPASERQLREWFGKHMITPAQTRGLALRGEHETAGLPNPIVDVLESRHLIRSDARGGTFWYELVHDRLIEPILQSNREWETARQTPLRLAAFHWHETNSDGLLYRDKALKEGLAWAQTHPDEVEPSEIEFLEASQKAEQARIRSRRLALVGAAASLAILIVMVVLTMAALRGQQASQTARATAEARRLEAVGQRQIAETAQVDAEVRRQVAVTAQAEALAQQSVAVSERYRAEQQARIAFARELAALALRSAGEKHIDLGLLLSLEANRLANKLWARDNLLGVIQASPSLITHLYGHTDSIWSVAFSPDGKLLASGGADGTIHLWDVATHQLIGQSLTSHSGDVYSVAFSPDGKLLAAGSGFGAIHLWDVATRQLRGQPLVGHTRSVSSIVFSHDGHTLASGSLDGTIRVWDVATGQSLGQPITGHDGDVYSVAFSPDDQVLASGGSDATVRLWEAATGKPMGQPRGGHTGSVLSVAFSPDGKALASSGSDATIRLWDTATGQIKGQPLTAHKGSVWSVAFSPDGQVLASGSSDATVRLWNVTFGTPLGDPLAAPAGSVNSVAFGPTERGMMLASGGKDKIIRLWHTTPHPALAQPLAGETEAVNGIAFAPNGQVMASGNATGTIRLWNMATRSLLGQLDGAGDVYSVVFSPDGKMLASGHATGAIRLWDVAARKPLERSGAISPGADHTDHVLSVAFSPDGKVLASGGADGTVRLWDVPTGKPLLQPITAHTGDVASVAFSPDGKLLVSGGEDGTLRLWDAATGDSLGSPLAGHTAGVMSVAFSPDGKTLASGGQDGVINLWDVVKRQPLDVRLAGHTDEVNSVAFSPDGRLLASGGSDGTVRLWDLESHQSIGQPLSGHAGRVTSVAFSPDGKLLVSASESDPTLIVWDVAFELWQSLACQIANRDLDAIEWKQYFSDQPGEPYQRTCARWLQVSPVLTVTPTAVSSSGLPTATPTPMRTPTPVRTSTPVVLRPPPTPTRAASSGLTPTLASGVIGPIGSGPLQAAWTSAGNCTMRETQDASGNRYWAWEADFYIEVHGGSAGYTISSPECRWNFSQQKYICRWGAREDGAVIQNVTVSCPNCKPVTLAIFQNASRGRGNVCELR